MTMLGRYRIELQGESFRTVRWQVLDGPGLLGAVASGTSDTLQGALEQAEKKIKELAEPKAPTVSEWFEECAPEDAVFVEQGGGSRCWSFFVAGKGTVELFDGFDCYEDALNDARAFVDQTPVRPRRGLK